MDFYSQLGIKRVVPAVGPPTDYGGVVMSPEVWKAMREAGRYFISMTELYEKSGERIAKLVGTEAAYVTQGGAGSIHAATAVCIARGDPVKIKQLPDTTDLPNEVIIQERHRHYWGGYYYFEKSIEVAGGRLVPVGNDRTCSPAEVESAITSRTAAIYFMVMGHTSPSGEDGLEETIRVAKKHGIPVIVDAASRVVPKKEIGKFNRMGADLVCYGGKYVGGPSASGFLVGRKDLLKALAGKNAWQWPHGRGLKMDRLMIVALVKALDMYMKTDVDARERRLKSRARSLAKRLSSIPGIKAEFVEEPYYGSLPILAPQVAVAFDDPKYNVDYVIDALKKNRPPIYVELANAVAGKDGSLVILPPEQQRVLLVTRTFLPDEEALILQGFRRLMRK